MEMFGGVLSLVSPSPSSRTSLGLLVLVLGLLLLSAPPGQGRLPGLSLLVRINSSLRLCIRSARLTNSNIGCRLWLGVAHVHLI